MTFKTWRPITAALLIVGLFGVSLSWNVHRAEAATVTFLTSGAGGGNQTYNVPANWNSSNNSIECIGSGGTSPFGSGARAGGGGGAYAKITNLSLTPGGTATYQVGTTATNTINLGANIWPTYFNGTASSSASLNCDWGRAESFATSTGGSTYYSIGSTVYAGGNGASRGSGLGGGGGGGGSAGPSGAGKDGGEPTGTFNNDGGGGGGGSNGGSSTVGAATSGTSGGNGGNGTGGSGGGAHGATPSNGTSGGGGGGTDGNGSGNTNKGANGSCDTAFDATHGACGGGGGAGSTLVGGGHSGGSGGTYGGGSGGTAFVNSGNTNDNTVGGQGIIVITYTAAVPIPPSATMKLQNATFILNKSTMLLSPQ